jgi:hypothetical protein
LGPVAGLFGECCGALRSSLVPHLRRPLWRLPARVDEWLTVMSFLITQRSQVQITTHRYLRRLGCIRGGRGPADRAALAAGVVSPGGDLADGDLADRDLVDRLLGGQLDRGAPAGTLS